MHNIYQKIIVITTLTCALYILQKQYSAHTEKVFQVKYMCAKRNELQMQALCNSCPKYRKLETWLISIATQRITQRAQKASINQMKLFNVKPRSRKTVLCNIL